MSHLALMLPLQAVESVISTEPLRTRGSVKMTGDDYVNQLLAGRSRAAGSDAIRAKIGDAAGGLEEKEPSRMQDVPCVQDEERPSPSTPSTPIVPALRLHRTAVSPMLSLSPRFTPRAIQPKATLTEEPAMLSPLLGISRDLIHTALCLAPEAVGLTVEELDQYRVSIGYEPSGPAACRDLSAEAEDVLGVTEVAYLVREVRIVAAPKPTAPYL